MSAWGNYLQWRFEPKKRKKKKLEEKNKLRPGNSRPAGGRWFRSKQGRAERFFIGVFA